MADPAVEKPVETTPAAEPADDFGAAFDQLSKLAESPDTTTAPTLTSEAAAPEGEKTPEEAPPKTEEEASGDGTTESKSEGDGAGSAAPAEGEGEDPPAEGEGKALTDDELLQRFARLVKSADKEAKPEPTPPPDTKPEPAKEEPPPAAVFTADEKQLLESYEKDWPDVARAEALRRREEYKLLAQAIYAEVGKALRPHLETIHAVAQRSQYQEIKTSIPDIDDVQDKVIAWSEKQPAYLREAYKRVIAEGTAEEIADLVGRYRAETGVRQQPAAAPKKKTELPTAAKQVAASMAPVSSKRSGAAQVFDPNDFDGAFAMAEKELIPDRSRR